MNTITLQNLDQLGKGFIAATEHLPYTDEYYLRRRQYGKGVKYRRLSAAETDILIEAGNTAANWQEVWVTGVFNPLLIRNCRFYGWVRIGALHDCYLEFNELKLPAGIYNSTVINCDFGDDVAIHNVTYLSNYIIENKVILFNVAEMTTTNHAKFGNGIVKEGEPESVRIALEICNENGGRSVWPFNGMMAADAYLWSHYREDVQLQEKFQLFTDSWVDNKRGYYGRVGSCTVIKNCGIIKDVEMGSHAYLKGANKLKNLTINSSATASSQVGEGCELVNGIVGYGCRIFYGVKAVRFVLADYSQLKYGARLINSYLAENSTISCCEVLNSLIFAAHEQHHNNSFLCAATVMGQSNIPAGATIGSNHNTRSADGEIVAGRGFWPALAVSLKHNSKFASFTLIAKGSYPHELNIHLPFSLVSQETHTNSLVIMPAYWFLYNRYALVRNAEKSFARDKRKNESIYYEYNYLAPDTVNEILDSLLFLSKTINNTSEQQLLTDEIVFKGGGIENSQRDIKIIKLSHALKAYTGAVELYIFTTISRFIRENKIVDFKEITGNFSDKKREDWKNLGGQLMPVTAVGRLTEKIKSGKITGWKQVHGFYTTYSNKYRQQQLQHAFSCWTELTGSTKKQFTPLVLKNGLQKAVQLQKQALTDIIQSRSKDYTNPFRTMMYSSEAEMNAVVGAMEDNGFIAGQQKQVQDMEKEIKKMIRVLAL